MKLILKYACITATISLLLLIGSYRLNAADDIFNIYKGNPILYESVVKQGDSIWLGPYQGLQILNTKTGEIDAKSGYSGKDVRQIINDKLGSIWVMSWSSIHRFKGNQWTNFDNTNSLLPDEMLNTLVSDSRGKIWIVTAGNELLSYENDNFISHNINPDNLENNIVKAITVDNNDNLWILSSSYGLIKYRDNTVIIDELFNTTISDKEIISMTFDKDNNLWFVNSSGLVKWKDGTSRIFDEVNSGMFFKNINIKVLFDNSGNAVINNNGLTIISENEITTFTKENSNLGENAILDFYIDDDNDYWVLTCFEGLYKISGSEVASFGLEHKGLFPEYHTKHITIDHLKRAWITTSSAICIKDGENWEYLSWYNSTIPQGNLRASAMDEHENIWFSIDELGLFRMNDKGLVNISEQFPEILGTTIPKIDYHSQTGNLYVATPQGIVKFDGKEWRLITSSLSNLNYCIDDDGTVWTNRYRYLCYTTGDDWVCDMKNGFQSHDFMSSEFAMDKKGNKWISTEKSIYKFDGKTWSELYVDSLDEWERSYAPQIAVDSKGNLWILGNYKGRLMKYDGEKFISKGWVYFGPEGRKASVMFFDKSDHLWIGSDWVGTYEIIDGDISSVDEDINQHDMLLFPNPSADFITIQFSNIGLKPYVTNDKVQIFDLLGIEIMSESIHPMTGSHRMNIEHLPAGVYFIRIGDRVDKFVKM